MQNQEDSYKTILEPSPLVLFKDRKSKFYAQAFPLEVEEEVKPIIETLKKQFPTANHYCYAWQLGINPIRQRANDDGEPKNSAGQPILGQLQSFEVTNILVVVVRIFGGTKLGVGGLINAYRATAELALKEVSIEEKTIEHQFQLQFEYPYMDRVMRLVKRLNLRVVSQKMEEKCTLLVATPKSNAQKVLAAFQELHQVSIKD